LEDISIDRFLPLYREGQAFEAFFDTEHLKQFFAACEEAGLLGRARYRNGQLKIPSRGHARDAQGQSIMIDYNGTRLNLARG
jgi:hypothetical protein